MNIKYIASVIFGVSLLAADSGNAPAYARLKFHDSGALPLSKPMPRGWATTPPIAHMVFCAKHPGECSIKNGRSDWELANYKPVKLTRNSWRQMRRINRLVNGIIRPQSDRAQYGRADVWTVSGNRGDCEDYALQKRKMLMRLGWPSHSLLVTIVKDHLRRPHAVLVARTTKGDFILDNLNSKVKAWNKVPYKWIKQQDQSDPRKWVRIDTNRPGYQLPSKRRLPLVRLARLDTLQSVVLPTRKPRIKTTVAVAKTKNNGSIKLPAPQTGAPKNSKAIHQPDMCTVAVLPKLELMIRKSGAVAAAKAPGIKDYIIKLKLRLEPSKPVPMADLFEKPEDKYKPDLKNTIV